jgi:recombination protein RecA
MSHASIKMAQMAGKATSATGGKMATQKARKLEVVETKKAEKNPGLEERQKAVAGAIQQIEKQFGKGSIMKLGDENSFQEIGTIPTGALTLDLALGIGGLPRGRIVEIFGPESSGKTTVCLSTVANAQRSGGIAAYVDAEHALDPVFARKLGVNIDDLLVAQPDNGEEALEIAESLVRSNAVDMVVVDSVAALVPKAELEGNMGDAQMGLHARLMSQAMRKLTGTISRSNTTVIFVNQIRNKIGVMFGSPETTTGGNALKFYASIRLDIRRIETLKKGEEAYGNKVRVKVVKNKLAPPFRQAEFDILFDSGISREGCLIDLGTSTGVVDRTGTWYSFKGDRIGQGRENAAQFMRDNPAVANTIEAEIRKQHKEKDMQKIDSGKSPEMEVDEETGEILTPES